MESSGRNQAARHAATRPGGAQEFPRRNTPGGTAQGDGGAAPPADAHPGHHHPHRQYHRAGHDRLAGGGRLGRPVPADLAAYALAVGSGHLDALRVTVLRELCYERLSSGQTVRRETGSG